MSDTTNTYSGAGWGIPSNDPAERGDNSPADDGSYYHSKQSTSIAGDASEAESYYGVTGARGAK